MKNAILVPGRPDEEEFYDPKSPANSDNHWFPWLSKQMKHYIVYSHGFGVRKDARGLFTNIAASMPDYEHVLFDYNNVDEASNTLTVSPFDEQVRRLMAQLEALDDGEEKIIDIVAHSQGCIIAALARPTNVRRILLITPPDKSTTERLVKFFGSREGSVMNLDGESRVPRRDGSTTVIPAAYWTHLQGMGVIDLYNQLPDLAQIKFILANDDEVLGTTQFNEIDKRIEIIRLPGNHDFTGEYRTGIISKIQENIGQ